MRILLVFVHELVRDTIGAYLACDGEVSVLTADDLASAASTISCEGPFDLVLIDHATAGADGLEGLSELLALNQGKPVAVVASWAPMETVERALAKGAAGFLSKATPAKSLVNAIRFMAAGHVYSPFTCVGRREGATRNLPPAAGKHEASPSPRMLQRRPMGDMAGAFTSVAAA